MSIFDIKCIECGVESEVLCKYSELEMQACQECGGEIEQIINNSCNFTLKGQGWAGKELSDMHDYLKTINSNSIDDD